MQKCCWHSSGGILWDFYVSSPQDRIPLHVPALFYSLATVHSPKQCCVLLGCNTLSKRNYRFIKTVARNTNFKHNGSSSFDTFPSKQSKERLQGWEAGWRWRSQQTNKSLGNLTESLLHLLQYTITVQSQRHFSFLGEIRWAVVKLAAAVCPLMATPVAFSLSFIQWCCEGTQGLSWFFCFSHFNFPWKWDTGRK